MPCGVGPSCAGVSLCSVPDGGVERRDRAPTAAAPARRSRSRSSRRARARGRSSARSTSRPCRWPRAARDSPRAPRAAARRWLPCSRARHPHRAAQRRLLERPPVVEEREERRIASLTGGTCAAFAVPAVARITRVATATTRTDQRIQQRTLIGSPEGSGQRRQYLLAQRLAELSGSCSGSGEAHSGDTAQLHVLLRLPADRGCTAARASSPPNGRAPAPGAGPSRDSTALVPRRTRLSSRRRDAQLAGQLTPAESVRLHVDRRVGTRRDGGDCACSSVDALMHRVAHTQQWLGTDLRRLLLAQVVEGDGEALFEAARCPAELGAGAGVVEVPVAVERRELLERDRQRPAGELEEAGRRRGRGGGRCRPRTRASAASRRRNAATRWASSRTVQASPARR